MNDRYDFSNAEKGKFYSQREELRIPVYLDADLSSIVNEILRKEIEKEE